MMIEEEKTAINHDCYVILTGFRGDHAVFIVNIWPAYIV